MRVFRVSVVSAVLSVLSVLCFSPAQAAQGDKWLELNGTSLHGDSSYFAGWQRKPTRVADDGTVLSWRRAERREPYNSDNKGFGIRYGVNRQLDAFSGFYTNSYNKMSFYGGMQFKQPVHLGHGWYVAPGLKFGVVTGYDGLPDDGGFAPFNGKVKPLLAPTLEVGARHGFVNVGVVPAVSEDTTWMVMIQAGYKLGR